MNHIKFKRAPISVLTFLHASRQFSIVGSCEELLSSAGQRGVQSRQILLQQLEDVTNVDVVQPEYNRSYFIPINPNILLLSCCSTENPLEAVLLLQVHDGLDIVDLSH